nr:6K1 [Donkey orchid virus A]
AKSKDMFKLEQCVAFVALVLMLFDNERSDAVFKILNKLKTTFTTICGGVTHQ